MTTDPRIAHLERLLAQAQARIVRLQDYLETCRIAALTREESDYREALDLIVDTARASKQPPQTASTIPEASPAPVRPAAASLEHAAPFYSSLNGVSRFFVTGRIEAGGTSVASDTWDDSGVPSGDGAE